MLLLLTHAHDTIVKHGCGRLIQPRHYVGGSTEFKLGEVAAQCVARAKESGKWAHLSLTRARVKTGAADA